MLTHHSSKHRWDIPPGFSLIERGPLALLLMDEYRGQLLEQGILNPRQLVDCGNASDGDRLRGRGQLVPLPLAAAGGMRMLGKHCKRGGLVRHLSDDIFWSGNRPFEEMLANRIIRERGIPTAEIIAAAQLRVFGPFYRGYIFSLEIPGCLDLISYFNGLGERPAAEDGVEKAAVIEAVAQALSTMHNRGIYHGDLHLKNVLVRPGNEACASEVYLIDFDKAVIKERLSSRERMGNLLRFNRSIEKYRFCGGAMTDADQLMLYRAYLKDNGDLQDMLCRGLNRSGRVLKLRRWVWRLRALPEQHKKKHVM